VSKLRRRPRSADLSAARSGDLPWDLFIELVSGTGPSGPVRVDITPERFRAIYWQHKDALMRFSSVPFFRPAAYWFVEVGGALAVGPDCPVNGNESQRSALVRLGLALSDQEIAQLSPAEANQWRAAHEGEGVR